MVGKAIVNEKTGRCNVIHTAERYRPACLRPLANRMITREAPKIRQPHWSIGISSHRRCKTPKSGRFIERTTRLGVFDEYQEICIAR